MKVEAEMEIGDDDAWNTDQLCRICANPNDYLIPIFQGEGLEHELQNKILKHLPIKVSENDKLPTQLCYQCASTLIAWHDLVTACTEAEEKFSSLFKEEEKAAIFQPAVDIKDETVKENCNVECNGETQFNERTTVVDEGTEIEGEEILINSSDDHGEIIIEEVKTMTPQVTEEVSSDSRSLASFNAYHQTQAALRTLEWVSSGFLFCILCGKSKQNHTMLIKHLSTEHTIRCGHCHACFGNEDRLSAHMRQSKCNKFQIKRLDPRLEAQKISVLKKESSKYPFQCNICLSLFSRRYDMKRHKLKHHYIEHSSGKENTNILSLSCEAILENNPREEKDTQEINEKSDMESYSDDSVNSEDISRHLDVKSRGSLCSVRTKRESQANRDIKENVERSVSKKQFSCSLCTSMFSRRSDLHKHISKKHGNDNVIRRCVDYVDDMDVEIINQAKLDISGTIVYRCNICDKNMRTRRGYVRHVRIHTGERPFTCHVCGKQYRSNADLTRHLRCVHDGVKNYPCDICGRCFASKGTRNDHRRTHTGEKPYVCHVCGKSFPTPNSIYVHRRIHTDHFPHSCTTCDKKFRRKQQLMNHVRTHTGEKPHGCDVCGKCFCTRDEVYRHKFTHSNEKPHICSVCGIRFGQKRYLSNHMKTNHS